MTTPSISSDDELDAAIAALGDNRRGQIDVTSTAELQIGPLNVILEAIKAQIALIEAERAERMKPLTDEEHILTASIFTYAAAHWRRLLNGGKRIVRPGGEIWSKRNPPKINIDDAPTVLERLHTLGLTRFIRTKEEPNLEAMGEDPAAATAVDGITKSQDTRLFVAPTDLLPSQELASNLGVSIDTPPT